MKDNKIIAAVDIGSSKITTLIARVGVNESSGDKSISIAGVSSSESRGVRKGQIVDIEEAVETVVASVESAERMAGYNLSSAYISVGGAHIASMNSHGVVAISSPDSEINNADIDRVIDAAKAVSIPTSREVIHVIPREYTVDGEGGVKDPVGMTGVRLEVETHLVSASSPAIRNLVKTVNEVGVEVEELVFSGLAASVAVFIEGALSYSTEIPIGAKNVTNDLAIGLRVSLETAEKIKLALSQKLKSLKSKEEEDYIDIATFGADESKKVSKKTLIEGIIRPRLNEIFTMVKLDLAKAEMVTKIPSGVVISGGGALTIGVVDSAKRMMSLPARIGEPKGVGGLIDDIMNPAYSTSIGLVLWGSKNIESGGISSLTKKLRFPTKGVFKKFIETVRNLLP